MWPTGRMRYVMPVIAPSSSTGAGIERWNPFSPASSPWATVRGSVGDATVVGGSGGANVGGAASTDADGANEPASGVAKNGSGPGLTGKGSAPESNDGSAVVSGAAGV